MTTDILEHVKGQLEFEFDSETQIGNLEEAMQLWEAVKSRSYGNDPQPPKGWEYIGCGGTRMVYLSPTGVCYKICHEYTEDTTSHNDLEHSNFRRIEREGKLPRNWRVPNSGLHVFAANIRKWDYHMRKEVVRPGRVAVIACEYIKGNTISWNAGSAELDGVRHAFKAVGLNDSGGQNAVLAEDGLSYYIIDAAELMVGD